MGIDNITSVEGGLGAVPGVKLSAVRAGIKASAPSDKLDLALIVFDEPQTAAAQITTNEIKAAPLLVSDRHLKASPTAMRAVVANSGCANACTGERGLADAKATARHAATTLGIAEESIIVASTGVIGVPMPMAKIEAGIDAAAAALVSGDQAAMRAARAIMTTDLAPKLSAYQFMHEGHTYTLGGIAKGSGMIAPSMATMLAFVATDFPLNVKEAQLALAQATADSFNMISVDGDMSTNDCIYFFAPHASAHHPTPPGLIAALNRVAHDLAVAMVRDGEGATKVLTAHVVEAASRDQARRIARAIVDSNLVRTALHGGDPNWGRIIAAAGSVGAGMQDELWSLDINGTPWVAVGAREVLSEQEAHAAIAHSSVDITVRLGLGTQQATAWGCDLSHAYVDINAHYRT
jgi:glutamate N-acetyltransferase/amino-acid N-acetyltransferase